jgi:hypothetical protein
VFIPVGAGLCNFKICHFFKKKKKKKNIYIYIIIYILCMLYYFMTIYNGVFVLFDMWKNEKRTVSFAFQIFF